MSGPIKNDAKTRQREHEEEWQAEQDYVDYADYNFDGPEDVGGDFPEYPSGPAYPTSGTGGPNPYGPGNATGGSKNLASGGGFGSPSSSQAQSYMQDLIHQGLNNAQIKQQMQAQFGYTPTDAEIKYAKDGMGGFNGLPGQYYQYSNTPQGKAMSKAYGTPGFQQWMDQQQQVQDAKSMARDMRKKEGEAKVKIHMILLQIMMGDLVGALRSYSLLMERDLRAFSRLIVKKLDGVRKARSMVIRNFARTKPPRAYAGQNPQTAARAQDRSSKYTQFVQMSTQLMNELQNTERELVDALQSQKRDLDNFLQSYASMRDDDKRVAERVMTSR
ncbi:hypothetical protein FBR05_03785 [Deltaproteobacteria bacterium PRO3]|nr:hypothetical protein [Deltaproteobacteria bacterium PRO3]